MARDRGRGDGTTESVRLFLIAQDATVEPLWSAVVTLWLCGIATIVPFHYWWGWPGAAMAAVLTVLAAAVVYWLKCKGPRSAEISTARLRLVNHRGRVCDQFERADVEAVELSNGILHVIEHGRRLHAVTVCNSVTPRALLRFRNALERHGWLHPDPEQDAAAL